MITDTWEIQPQPDFTTFAGILQRTMKPERVHFFELFSELEEPILKKMGLWEPIPKTHSPKDQFLARIQNHCNYMLYMGYDYINVSGIGFGFPHNPWGTAPSTLHDRSFQKAHDCTIADRNDFNRYPFPDMSTIDYAPFEWVASVLPKGMKVIPTFSGMLENVVWLMGLEALSMRLYDDPVLVGDMFEHISSRIITYFEKVAQYDCVGAICMGDDMGYRTQTLLSPETMRTYLFPWHQKLVKTVHSYEKPIILHACGNLEAVMEDIIACGWDAKHSFEDAIIPVWESQKKWGNRISVLGGFDIDRLIRTDIEQIKSHARFMVEQCQPNGGWAMGTGNSVADYIPVDHFLAMQLAAFLY